MHTDDIDKLAGPELSAAVAREVMGWSREIFGGAGYCWKTPDGKWEAVFKAHRDRNDAHRVLMRCPDLGIETKVWKTIADGLESQKFRGWVLLTIDPAIICRAALRAVMASR